MKVVTDRHGMALPRLASLYLLLLPRSPSLLLGTVMQCHRKTHGRPGLLVLDILIVERCDQDVRGYAGRHSLFHIFRIIQYRDEKEVVLEPYMGWRLHRGCRCSSNVPHDRDPHLGQLH
ncbi:hypothetical protein EDC04DRAFT_1603026 [Pisolithus marmoratus]|nr:hypothetical protein EDC04DRAFT_1603026 [Pisolithus marmoratus]